MLHMVPKIIYLKYFEWNFQFFTTKTNKFKTIIQDHTMYMLKKYGQILILLLFYENNNADQVVDAFIQRSMHVRFIVSKNFFALHAVS